MRTPPIASRHLRDKGPEIRINVGTSPDSNQMRSKNQEEINQITFVSALRNSRAQSIEDDKDTAAADSSAAATDSVQLQQGSAREVHSLPRETAQDTE
ncbi:hypothetical protein VNO78_07960 [Psophocarpus tetragonolobus]|uniref:Uncharacterized protein n=1 Tax=Psophocarpus tetragonolobus TaxID=3891 RepID=A0AAN9SVJ9_PSOTE